MARYLVDWYYNKEYIANRSSVLNIQQLLEILPMQGHEALDYLHSNPNCVGVMIGSLGSTNGEPKGMLSMKITDLLKRHQYCWWMINNEPSMYWKYIYRELW